MKTARRVLYRRCYIYMYALMKTEVSRGRRKQWHYDFNLRKRCNTLPDQSDAFYEGQAHIRGRILNVRVHTRVSKGFRIVAVTLFVVCDRCTRRMARKLYNVFRKWNNKTEIKRRSWKKKRFTLLLIKLYRSQSSKRHCLWDEIRGSQVF